MKIREWRACQIPNPGLGSARRRDHWHGMNKKSLSGRTGQGFSLFAGSLPLS
jgi:hypothetical protein